MRSFQTKKQSQLNQLQVQIKLIFQQFLGIIVKLTLLYLSVVCAWAKNASRKNWQEKPDLNVKYRKKTCLDQDNIN